jgi:GH15 family glucan-1,4-alpha-glucosidase
MPRPLVLGNGNLLVTLDDHLQIRDLYWPYVGLYNHVSGARCRVGIWVAGRFSWLADHNWQRRLRYLPDSQVTDSMAHSDSLGVSVHLHEAVLRDRDILLRRFTVHNHHADDREVRLFLTHDFVLAETDIGDTAFFNPYAQAMIHYKRSHYLLIGGRGELGGIAGWATGIKGFGGAEGTWRDCEDGALSMNSVAQGSVDSAVHFNGMLAGHHSTSFDTWLCAGATLQQVCEMNNWVTGHDVHTLIHETARYWTAWSAAAEDARITGLPAGIGEEFRRSLLIIRTNIDNRGAIIAANDSDIMETARAHYSYMWPRDGALVCAALDRLGFQRTTRRFFEFCRDILPADRAALLHKYSADGSWGSTWHPWLVEGGREIPFQQDSTNLTVWALWQHFRVHRDIEFTAEMYFQLARPCAEFLLEYRDTATGLPLPSYDLWEERRGVHAYTCGTLFGALDAAARLSELFADGRHEQYRAAAHELQQGVEAHLWDESSGRYARRLITRNHHLEGYERDMTIDSALFALAHFGMFGPNNPRLIRTLDAVIDRLTVKTEVGGLARYEQDYYFRRSDDFHQVPGNPWIICSLWAAQWRIACAETVDALQPAVETLEWCCRHALPGGALPEQVNGTNGEPLSVAPLTWSHAEFLWTVMDLVEKRELLEAVEGR